MLGIHCFLPKLNMRETFTMTHINVLTWAMSIISYRRVYGDIRLITNKRGKKIVETIGLTPAYGGNISTELEDVVVPYPERFSKTFWAGCKLYALRSIKEVPCCMVDLDAVIWSPLPNLKSACSFLHFDYNTWDCYKNNKTNFLKYLPEKFRDKRIWKFNAANTAIMAFYNLEFKQLYEEHAIDFMVNYSNKTKLLEKDKSEMVFAEQRMLSLCSKLYNIPISPVSTLKGAHLSRNPFVTHLWNSKSFLLDMWQANKRYSEWAIRYIRKYAPELENLCAETEKIIKNIEVKCADEIQLSEKAFRYDTNTIEVKNINGDFRVYDTNLPVLYKTNADHLGFMWEDLHLVCGTVDIYKQGIYQKTIRRDTPTQIVYGETKEDIERWKILHDLIGEV